MIITNKNNMCFEILCYGDNIKSKYIDFPFDFNMELSKQLDLLKEDLIHIEYTNGYILDVGYYPEFSPNGEFKIVVSKGVYDNQLIRCTTKDINTLIEKINVAVNFVNKGVKKIMPRFFVNVEDENNIIIEGDDARHIGRSLRMKVGDDITVTCKGTDYHCTINTISDSVVTLNLVEKIVCKSEPSVKLILFQAIPKGDKFETILQKSIELGASEIVPVLTRRCVSRPTEKDFARKLKRYEKISESASKQSGRGIIPKIHSMVTLDKAIEMMQSNDLNYILYENGGERFSAKRLKDIKSVGVFIGSEGGFDLEEVERVKSKGGVPIWLGERILRCETAPLSAITIIMHLTGNM